MEQDHGPLVRRWFEEVWNQGKDSTIDEMLDADALVHGIAPAGMELRGPTAFKAFFETFRSAFPDIRVSVEDSISQGDRVAGRWSARMTHRGDQLGIPATGKTVAVTGMVFIRVANGKFVEGWNNWDLAGLLQQLGVAPEPKLM